MFERPLSSKISFLLTNKKETHFVKSTTDIRRPIFDQVKLHWSSILHDVRHCLWVPDYALRISGITKEGRKEYA